MRARLDHTGRRYGALVALRDVGTRDKNRMWLCRCDCGNEIVVKSADFGPSRRRASCGCLAATIGDTTRKHGMSNHPAHGVWMSMINRCHLPTAKYFENYGGRGIFVCKRWRYSFAAFWEDMGANYSSGLLLERKNDDRGYTKQNCYWATRIQQNRNKRNNVIVKTTEWGPICLAEAARRAGVSPGTLKRRLAKGLRI